MARVSGDKPAPEPLTDEPEARPARRRSRSAGVASALGAVIAGVDQQILRGIPRAEILVERGSQLRGERTGGGDLIVDMPEPLVRPARDDPASGPR